MENEKILYVVMDRKLPGALVYMRDLGLNAYAIYNSIEDVRNPILMETHMTRLVIVETGAGALTSTKNREELIDIIGMQDENTSITVFYIDENIKRDALKSIGKTANKVDWVKYKSTLDCVAETLKYKENYILDEYAEKEDLDGENELTFKGEKFKGDIVESRGNLAIEEIRNIVNVELESLTKYEVIM